MNSKDERIDVYIANSRDFAVPVLEHLRHLVHRYCPQAQETLKWGFPHFMYHKTILCSMASFTSHCAFGFWNGKLLEDSHGLFITEGNEKAMGQLGQIRSLKDLPKDEILGLYIMQSMTLIEQGVKLPKKPKSDVQITVPDEIHAALLQHSDAFEYFNKLSNSHKKEYLQWISEAKLEATRAKRLSTMIQWLEEGRNLNWKYEGKMKNSS
ncbi:MAG: YdeI/OmpD-associated family protein [Bacteroidetes bacterium]|nr:YdeI/OmpD-associated family protein [Bacteroidota bacterium]